MFYINKAGQHVGLQHGRSL